MSSANITILITIICYMLMTIIVGLYFSNKNKNTSDFYLGGRKLGPFVTAMSAEASDMSAYLLMGIPGLAYISGSAEAFWTVLGLGIGTYINWLIVAKRLRLYSNRIGAITIPDFFANRFKDKHLLNIIPALIIIIFFVPYTGSGFAACGKLFRSLFGANYHVAMIISAAVIILYTTLGGFLAASTTDFVQGIIMTVALLSVVAFGIWSIGGFDKVFEIVQNIPGYLGLTHTTTHMGVTDAFVAGSKAASHHIKDLADLKAFKDLAPQGVGSFGVIAIVSTLAWGLGYFGMPHVLLRFMAIDNPNKLKKSRRVASVWVFISMFVALFIGLMGQAMFRQGTITPFLSEEISSIVNTIDSKIPINSQESIIVEISKFMSHNAILLAIVAGIILAGILASTMSTSDSQLLAASSSVSENILDRVFHVKLSDKKKMLIARIAVILIAIIGIVIAWDPDSNIFNIVSFAWGGFGATFGPVMLASLFWKRANKYGAIAGMIAGAATIFIWKFLIRPIFDIYELLPAFLVATITIIVVSLLTPAPEAEIQEEFDSVKKAMKA